MKAPETAPPVRRRFPIPARIALAVLAIGILWHGIENIRGRNAWAKAESHLLELGIPLGLTEALQSAPPKPVGPNFCHLPMLAALRQFSIDPENGLIFDHPQLVSEFDSLQLPLKTGEMPDFGSISLQQPVDLTAWAQWLRSEQESADAVLAPAATDPASAPAEALDETVAAEQILAELSGSQWVFDSLLEAASNSAFAAFPSYISGGESLQQLVDLPLPEISRMLHVGDAIHLRGLAQLALSNPDAALQSILVLQRFGEALRSGPTLIHAVNASYLDEACLHIVWDGLRRLQWSDVHLTELRSLLSRIRPQEHFRHTLVVELNATVIIGCDYFKANRGRFAALSRNQGHFDPDHGINPSAAIFWQLVMPRGWLDQNKAGAARLLVDHAILPLGNKQAPAAIDPSALARTPYRMFTRLILPGHLESVLFATEAATWLSLADTAMAIRQFELEKGTSPAELSALVSAGLLQQIPPDPWSPERTPLSFQIKESDHGPVWHLHSIGVDPERAPHASHRPEWSGLARP